MFPESLCGIIDPARKQTGSSTDSAGRLERFHDHAPASSIQGSAAGAVASPRWRKAARLARRRCPSRGATTLPSINGNYCAAVERLGIVTGRGRVDLTSALCTEDSVRCPLGGAGYSGFFGTTATWLGVRCLGGRRLGVRLRLCFGRYLVPYLIPVT